MYTSHGHQIVGTPVEGDEPETRARCGGPSLCDVCAREAANARNNQPTWQTLFNVLDIKGTKMQFQTYTRKPFQVEAVEITEENIHEVAEHVGTVRKKDDGTPYIFVDRRLVPNVYRVYPGFFMTKMGDNIRCYSAKIFKEQFELSE